MKRITSDIFKHVDIIIRHVAQAAAICRNIYLWPCYLSNTYLCEPTIDILIINTIAFYQYP